MLKSRRFIIVISTTAHESEIALPWNLASDILRKITNCFTLASESKQSGYSSEFVLISSLSNIHVFYIRTSRGLLQPIASQKPVDIG